MFVPVIVACTLPVELVQADHVCEVATGGAAAGWCDKLTRATVKTARCFHSPPLPDGNDGTTRRELGGAVVQGDSSYRCDVRPARLDSLL